MPEFTYQGLLFPDRAESVDEYRAYRVYLDPWDEIAARMRTLFEGVALRRESRILAIHGDQGTGKTLLANRLRDDHARSVAQLGDGSLEPDRNNFWHRVSGTQDLRLEFIRQATTRSKLYQIENDKEWYEKAKAWIAPLAGHPCIILADNAERLYFRQSLVGLSDAQLVELGDREETVQLAGQNLVSACRTYLRGSLIVIFTNDDLFLLQLHDAIEAQHANLMQIASLPLPQGADKEGVVRVNINRLNPVSYWHCVDKAGPSHKSAVRRAIVGASNFPDSFRAVDEALRTAPPSRQGRRAKKNQISLIVLCREFQAALGIKDDLGSVHRAEAEAEWGGVYLYDEGWAGDCLDDAREASFLESEWNLRLVVLGEPFVVSLLSVDDTHKGACTDMLEFLKPILGPGTWGTTREARTAEFAAMIGRWPVEEGADLDEFWGQGQGRAARYEAALGQLLPGYNTGGSTFLGYRPDYVVEPFSPCEVTSAISSDSEEITRAIQRSAHVFEFTAQARPDLASVRSYLASKLPNYVRITQDQ